MPAIQVHYAFGLMLAYFLGYRGKSNMKISIFSLAPDFDILLSIPFMIILSFVNVNHSTYVWLNFLFAHRGISHTFLMVLVIMGIVYLITRNRKTVINAGILMLSHLILDYTITWELKPLAPFYMGRMESGTVEFMDPVINILTLIFIILFIFHRVVNSEKYRKKHGEKYLRLRNNFSRIVKYTFVFLCVFMLVLFTGKGIGLYSRAGWKDADYHETVAYGMYDFVYCTEENDTHWEVVSFGLFSLDEEISYVEKVDIRQNDTNRLLDFGISLNELVERCHGLLDTQAGTDQMLDYYALKIVIKNDGTVKVNAFDARVGGSGATQAHSSGYVFEFENGDLSDFRAFRDGRGFGQGEVPRYQFE